MKPKFAPFTTWMDWDTGLLKPERGRLERRLSDMTGYYVDESDVDPEELVYRIYPIPVEKSGSEIQCSTTVIEPGRVADEYFMTKGHFHKVWHRSEIYLGVRGEGRLLMATEAGKHAVEPIRPGSVSYVPGGWAHRSLNVGDEPLVFFAAYVGDAGHDYLTIAERGFPVRIVAGANGPEVVDNPRYRKGVA